MKARITLESSKEAEVLYVALSTYINAGHKIGKFDKQPVITMMLDGLRTKAGRAMDQAFKYERDAQKKKEQNKGT